LLEDCSAERAVPIKEVNMRREKFYLIGIFVLSLYFIFPPGESSAENRDVSLQLWGQVSPFIHGEAGSGPGAPDYKDAFGTGVGGGMDLSWRFADRFSLLGGIGYEKYDGKTHEDISFDDLKVIPVSIGGKFHFLPKDSRWNPYVKMDLGAAYLSSVDISIMTLKGRYWDSSWVFLFEVGAGVEYRIEKWGIGLEVLPRYLGKPDSALGPPSDATSSWTIPVRLGVSYHF
jgi:opacity protein-like surface antigen